MIIKRIRDSLQDIEPTELAGDWPEAAVLVAIQGHPQPQLLLTVRSSDLPSHAGEVAFPGGKRDPGDPDVVATALREAQEEVGIDPGAVEVLGTLRPMISRFGLKVTPVVGMLTQVPDLRCNPAEVDDAFWAPLEFFRDREQLTLEPREKDGRHYHMPYYQYLDFRVWGLTAAIIIDLLNTALDFNVRLERKP